jgi:hypothetical protein
MRTSCEDDISPRIFLQFNFDPVVAPNNGVNKSTCKTGFGFGFTAGADGGAGLGLGASGLASVGGGLFFGGSHPSIGGFLSGGLAAFKAGFPSQIFGPSVSLGGGAAAGVGVFFTNASSASQLKGSSLTIGGGVDIGVGGGVQISFGTDAAGNSIWQVSITGGPGAKAYGYGITTKTGTVGTGAPCK